MRARQRRRGTPVGRAPRQVSRTGRRMGRAGRRVAAGGPRRHVPARAGGRRRLRAGRGGVPVPDLLLHLARDRARPVRPAGPGAQRPPAVAGPGLLRRHPGRRRAAVRSADLQVGAGGPRARRAGGDDRRGRQWRPDPAAGQRRQGGRVGDLHRHRRLGRPGGPDRADRLRAASSLGQWVKMPENRLRILVACGAAGGISATFNAPITGVFFGVEIILREFSIDALFTVMLVGDDRRHHRHPVPGRQAVPVRLPGRHLAAPCPQLPAGRGAGGGRRADGPAFKTVLYKTEDLCDRLWKGRPEWASPAVGGIALGSAAAGHPADVRGRLPGDVQRHGGRVRAVVPDPARVRQDRSRAA